MTLQSALLRSSTRKDVYKGITLGKVFKVYGTAALKGT